MRVTDNMRLVALLHINQVAQGRLTEASRHASLGSRVSLPSDDPVGYATMIRRTSSIATFTARTETARSSADELSIAERALDSASEIMSQAQSLAVQGSNETLSPSDRSAIATQILGLRDQLLQTMNIRGSTGYLFGGTETSTAPFDNGGHFLGNDNIVRMPIGDGVAPRGNASGAKAFTVAGGRDVLADLSDLATALNNGDVTNIRAGIDNMRSGHDQIVQEQVQAGLSVERMQSAADVMDQSIVSLSQSRTRAIGAEDLAALVTDLAFASTSYQQSLDATKKLLSLPSLAQM